VSLIQICRDPYFGIWPVNVPYFSTIGSMFYCVKMGCVSKISALGHRA